PQRLRAAPAGSLRRKSSPTCGPPALPHRPTPRPAHRTTRPATNDASALQSAAVPEMQRTRARTAAYMTSEFRPQRPDFRAGAFTKRLLQLADPLSAASTALTANYPLDGEHMFVAPREQRVIQIQELFRQLIKRPVLLGVAVDFEPRRLDSFIPFIRLIAR